MPFYLNTLPRSSHLRTGLVPIRFSRSLTVQRIYSSPSLSGTLTRGIEWSPDSKRISYLQSANGSTELWTMDAATGTRVVLVKADTMSAVTQPEKTKSTQSTGLGRVEPENYIWAPDGNSLLFIGSTNLVLLDLKTMAPKTLVSGASDLEDAKFSPDGKWIGFVRDSNLWVVNSAGGDARPLTTGGSEEVLKGKLDWVYPEELNTSTAYWWSPDSSKIAYYQMDERPVTRYPIVDMSSSAGAIEFTRFPQAGEANPVVRVAVVPVSGGATKWMGQTARMPTFILPGSTGCATAAASPFSGSIAPRIASICSFAMSPPATRKPFSPTRTNTGLTSATIFISSPTASASSGPMSALAFVTTTPTIFPASNSRNSPAETGASPEPAVSGRARPLILPSMKLAVTCTFSPTKTASRKPSFTASRLPINTSSASPNSPAPMMIIVAPDDSRFVDTYSNIITPPRQDLYLADGTLVAPLNENKVAELGSYNLSRPEFLNLSAGDGTRLYAMMIKPAHFDASHKYPVLIDVYGGPQVQNVKDEWTGNNLLWLEFMAQKGYLIFSLDNRGSYNRGHAFETPIYHQFGKVELEDQLTGVNYLKSLAFVDQGRIGIWGWSYGGFMTLDALFNAPGVFKAGVSVAPVSDWRLYDTIYTERYMGKPQDDADGYSQSSPASHASALVGKLMLAHGTGDDNVHFANTSEVIDKMIQGGKYPSDLAIFPGRGHGISDRPARIQLFDAITQFFMNNL